jgi:DNA-binding GntR family transcriptional regulator
MCPPDLLRHWISRILQKLLMTERSATLAETVASALAEAIQNGDYYSGERLRELFLADLMNVSQNTIRDALRILEQQGWVVKRSRHGVYVRAFTRAEAEEIYALWGTLEALALRWTMQPANKAHLDNLRQYIKKARRHFLANQSEQAQGSLTDFHRALRRAANKPQTADLLERLHNQAQILARLRDMRAPLTFQQQEAQIAAYETIVGMLELGDVGSAAQSLQAQIMAECDAVLPALELTAGNN